MATTSRCRRGSACRRCRPVGNNGTVTRSTARAARLDSVCAKAVDVAYAVLADAVDPAEVGEHLQAVAEGDRLVTHLFDCHLAGYQGWRWAVTVTRVSRSRQVTVCETVLLPGPDALLAPGWLPWHDRLQPGDLGVGDLLPTSFDDDRLAPGYLQSDDPAVEEVSWELGLGRSRVMSREGRADTAQRWYDGEHGPQAPISVAAPDTARCGTCGFYLVLAGALRQAFGVCGNVYAPDDGRVVSVDHGCGAHSETLTSPAVTPVDELPTVYDDGEVETVTVRSGPAGD
ncbi:MULTISPECIES: DUF3027 domain-containing protein [unclassified Solwaraspora]|uniref:DUF3027 domain-containing protein n=1 Tax=unclassified Solwaraspora TaxID=2627926 RepID=UPI00248CD66B|nr:MULTISPECIES: DUF3027 domain-containing protein [unclassified Solwaraspora]WBC00451.1 DUF3027 domain-containing protein [Solwaraspora sp. WMMA2059]WBC23941.1 DUF3027 domain-containing protein [Solwaraspora sp. WMMA2080]WJK37831.1 DUF3027 domain-containing protein [Solwaraspora sp. WMMA2065]